MRSSKASDALRVSSPSPLPAAVLRWLLALGVGFAAMAAPPAAMAQAAAGATTLVTLGTQGGPSPNTTRSQPANAVIVNGQPYLVDAGNGVVRQLGLAGIRFVDIRQIFLTHHHDDHNADAGTLMGLVWSLGVAKPITVYGPLGTSEFVQGFKRSFAANEQLRRADFPDLYKVAPEQIFQVKELGELRSASTVFQDKNVRVDAIENCHYHFDAGSPASGARSYALRFVSADKTIVFSGDTGPCERLAEFARGADILVHEVIAIDLWGASFRARSPLRPERSTDMLRHMKEDHTTPEDVGKLAAKAGVGMVVLTHVIPGNAADPAGAYVEGVSRFYPGRVVLAADLMKF